MSMFYENAIEKYPSKMAFIKPTNVSYMNDVQRPSEHGDVAYVHKESSNVSVQSDALVSVQAQTTVSSSILAGGTVDFRPARGTVTRFDHCYLRLSISNTTGAACTIQVAPLLLKEFELYAQNGNRKIFTQQGLENWLEKSYFDYIDWEGGLKSLLGSDSNYSTSGVVIANNTSTTLYIPIVTFFSSARLFMAGLKEDLLFRFTFNSSDINIIAGANPTVSDCKLLLRGAYLPDTVKNHHMKLYRSMKLDFPFLDLQRSNVSLTLAPSSTYSVVMSGINSLVSSLFITFRQEPVNAASYATFVNGAATYDITNQSGSQSLIGAHQRSGPSADNRNDNVLIQMEYQDNLFLVSGNNKNIIYIPFNRHPKQTLMTGSSGGFQPFTSFELFKFTCPSTLVGGNYRLDFFARTLESAQVRDGGILNSTGAK